MLGQKTKRYVVTVFEPDIGFSYCEVDASSANAAKNRVKSSHFRYVDTQIVIGPKKHRRLHKISHKFANNPDFEAETAFISAIEKSEFERLCDEADRQWESKKERVRQNVARYKKPAIQLNIEDLPEALRQRIALRPNGCWLWRLGALPKRSSWKRRPTSRVRRNEYGTVTYEGRKWPAHRLIYTLLFDEIPEGAVLMHTCDTPACVNPDHLTPGTPKDNFVDMIEKKRSIFPKRRRQR